MLGVDGNILIKHNDKWRGDYYLKEDLTFTTNKFDAARFYLLKSGDTTIINGDRISINCGNRVLTIVDNELRLIDRSHNYNSFIITNGTDNTDPIIFETVLYFISDSRNALKYEWGMDLIIPTDNSIEVSAANYQPHSHPHLSNYYYGETCTNNSFEFILERSDTPIISREISRVTHANNKSDEGYRGIIMIVLLMVILVLCFLLSK